MTNRIERARLAKPDLARYSPGSLLFYQEPLKRPTAQTRQSYFPTKSALICVVAAVLAYTAFNSFKDKSEILEPHTLAQLK